MDATKVLGIVLQKSKILNLKIKVFAEGKFVCWKLLDLIFRLIELVLLPHDRPGLPHKNENGHLHEKRNDWTKYRILFLLLLVS